MFFAKIKPGWQVRIGEVTVEFSRKTRIGRYIELKIDRPDGVHCIIEKAPEDQKPEQKKPHPAHADSVLGDRTRKGLK